MTTWHKGRVALVGDSAYCPSFLSGQGTSVALIGAFVLASELVANPDPEQAFVASCRASSGWPQVRHDRMTQPISGIVMPLARHRGRRAVSPVRKIAAR